MVARIESGSRKMQGIPLALHHFDDIGIKKICGVGNRMTDRRDVAAIGNCLAVW